MKEKSVTKPKICSVKIVGDKAYIKLCENISKEKEVNEEIDAEYFLFDCYRIERPARPNIENDILSNFADWICLAKKEEKLTKENEIRKKRNELLSETDAEATVDRLMQKYDIEKIEDLFDLPIMKYRQKLRDITKQTTFPDYVVFPVKPIETNNINEVTI